MQGVNVIRVQVSTTKRYPQLKAINHKLNTFGKYTGMICIFGYIFCAAEPNPQVDYWLDFSTAVFINYRARKIRKRLAEEIKVEDVATQTRRQISCLKNTQQTPTTCASADFRNTSKCR